MTEPVPDMEALEAARKDVLDAISRYADGWSNTEGGIVVTFIALAEVATPSGSKGLLEIRGAGQDGNDALSSWTRQGMLFSALHDPSPEPDNT